MKIEFRRKPWKLMMESGKVEYTVKSIREQISRNTLYGDSMEAIKFLMDEYDDLHKRYTDLVFDSKY